MMLFNYRVISLICIITTFAMPDEDVNTLSPLQLMFLIF